MTLRDQTLYNSEIRLNGLKIAYAGEIKFKVDAEVNSEMTTDGTLKAPAPTPGCSLDVTKYTKHEAVTEQAFQEAIWSLLHTPGTITIVNKKKAGTLTRNLYDVYLSGYEDTDKPGELFSRDLSFEAEDFDDHWD